jgi:hypothetical protein
MFDRLAGTAILAHQGGWDEVLLVAGPIVAIAGLLLLAKRRVDRSAPLDGSDSPGAPASGHHDTP